ncbi:hypothetical protein SAMN04487848_1997 [Microbacterium sp. ru370.1]|uniref:hypothetical protein n=1 Tax=unclassified Microbacterium TaxID=2609290 RepID=UPI00088929AA|nr:MULTISPECIES: hypothetical protein [unclassified Microbacterium]SDO76577.1 hypothetical protein SAMN04487848_1997 [Microbacterium sp. ru370.1]SIT88605.1 hypothetical protein SAMN05880579_1992 [Microbacterium sp. RU1D]
MSTTASASPAEPFVAYLRRRGASATALTPGEVVTATVGLLRGCRRATDRSGGSAWWLTAEGRPVVVGEDSAPDVVTATADSLGRLAALTPDPTTRDLVDRARAAVSTRPPREWDAVERRLFSHADPKPLVLGPLTPVVVDQPPTVPSVPARGPFALLDDDIGAAIRRSLTSLRERWGSSSRFRGSAVGAGVAAAVLVGAAVFLPGTAEPAPAASATPGVSRTAPPSATVVPQPSATSPWPVDDRVPLSDDMVVVARRLFAEIALCADDPCRSAFDEPSTFGREPLLADAEHAEITLLEDFGGVTVVHVAYGATTQYVTLVRQNDRWLVRAVETVADQPS